MAGQWVPIWNARGPQGPQGPQGLPGPGAVAADSATAAYIAGETSETNAALLAGVLAKSAKLGDAVREASAQQDSQITGIGSSYMQGIRSSNNATKSHFALTAAAGEFTTISNRGVGGSTSVENFWDAATDVNNQAWVPLTDGGVVIVDSIINNVQLMGGSGSSADQKGLQATFHSLTALCALLRARRIVEGADSAFTYTGVWSYLTNATMRGGTARYTTAANATAKFRFTGREGTVILFGKDSAAGGTTYGPVGVSIDGGPEIILDLNDMAKRYDSGSGNRYGATISLAPFPVFYGGLHSGQHEITIRNVTEGNGLVLDFGIVGASNPPGIVLVKDAGRPDWSTSIAGGNNQNLVIYNDQLARVADKIGGPITVADPNPGWNVNTMTDIADGFDGKHPNDLGHAHYAKAIIPKMRGLGPNPAWSGRKVGEGYGGSQLAAWGA